VSSLAAELEAAAQIGADGGGVTRFAWSPELGEANEWLIGRLEGLGLETAVDAAGNVFGRWNAGEGKAVLVGSHLDTVPRGGRYDGALGVLAALETARALKADGIEPQRPLWVVSFNDEEGGRFQTGMLGSRAFCGELDLDDWRRRGVPDAMAESGFDFERLPEARGVERGAGRTSASSRPSRGCSASASGSSVPLTMQARRQWRGAATRLPAPPGSCSSSGRRLAGART
jgi:allantoate deiminase